MLTLKNSKIQLVFTSRRVRILKLNLLSYDKFLPLVEKERKAGL
ncbi:MAG: hypothetical protein QXX95_03745 [Nitrososphaerales archaeon]